MVVRNGLISEITVRADGSIPIPGTPIIISMLSGSITNIDTLDFAQITWSKREALPDFDFLEGDVDFVRRLAGK